MAVDLEAIHRALAAQVFLGTGADKTVYPFPVDDPQFPCITVYPASGDYIMYFATFGPDGKADLMLRLKLDVSGDKESMGIALCDYLSVGTGNGSSIVDAVMADRSLNNTVEDAVVLSAEWGDPDTEPGVAWLPVRIILKKQNAEA